MSLIPNSFNYEWIIDSGVTYHITSCKYLLAELKYLDAQNLDIIQLPIENKAQIAGMGKFIIQGGHILKEILHVPNFKFNLISVGKLTRDLLCSVSFFPNFCVLQALYSGNIIGIDRESKGLYLLKINKGINTYHNKRWQLDHTMTFETWTSILHSYEAHTILGNQLAPTTTILSHIPLGQAK